MNINKVSEEMAVSKDTLRYWERIGLLPEVQRNDSGYRDYSESDMNWVLYIKALRRAGMSIESLIDFVKLYREPENTKAARKSLLMEQKKRLEAQEQEIQKSLNYLNFKIEHFDDHMLTFENEKLSYRATVTK
ncbi:MAG: MerR family transcriptional regulator [Lentilactobacillus diolivorans]|uniref:MerR family transcriptional regulator n=1 Tax=Lentilactobacillus diolivorans TaxID=179838 RepID=UPI0039ED6BCE